MNSQWSQAGWWVLNTYKSEVTYTSTQNVSPVAADTRYCGETCKCAVVGEGEMGHHRDIVVSAFR